MDTPLSQATQQELTFLIRKYDGIICTVDFFAYTLIRFAPTLGVRVPEDLLVSGEGDTPWCSRFEKQITTLSTMAEELCSKAFRILDEGGIHHEKVVPDIIYRESTNR